MAGLPWEDAAATPWGALQGTTPPAKKGAQPNSMAAAPQAASQPVPAVPAPPVADPNEGVLSRYGNLFGEGMARGAVSLAGLPASADEFLSGAARQYLPQSVSSVIASPEGGGLHSVLPDVTDVQNWLSQQEQKYGVAVAPPQTMGERFASATGQGVGGALAGGAGDLGAARAAISGAGSGAASQAAQEAGLPPWAVVAAGVAGGGAGMLGAKPTIAAGNAAKSAVQQTIAPGAKLLEQTFSPTTVDASSRAAEAMIRTGLGKAARDTAITADQMIPFRKTVTSLPQADKHNLVDYMETRSSGNAPKIAPELQGVADAARDAYQLRATKLSNLPEYAQRQFIEDYYPHMWVDPNKARQFGEGFGKEGSGRSLKGRSIPTLADGIAAGLQPVTDDPVQMTLDYAANMDRFIATKQVFDQAEQNGLVRVIPPGKTPPQDWVRLNTFVGKKGLGSEAYAPEGFARVYNNFTSKGFGANETAGKWYDALQTVNGGVNAMQLGLSAFHLATMSQEAAVNDVAKGIAEAFSGSPVKAARSIVGAPLAPVRTALKGGQVLKEYLNPGTQSPLMKTITDLGTEANMNIATITKDLRASNAGSYWNAIKRGTLRMELAADARTALGAPVTGTAKVFFKNVGRALDTVAQPMFEKYIPRLKAGAFYENMKSWLEMHPDAPHAEQVRMARQVWDSIDNRFGEMNHDNIFWNQALKQSARLALRSYSWKMGTLREIGGAAADIARNPKSLSMGSDAFSPRAAYAIALPLTYGALMSAYQYMKTGQAPQDLHDLVAGRTGGTDAGTGQPERVELPSYMKDVFGWVQSPHQEVMNSLSPLATTAQEAWTGNDWKNQPIANPNGAWPEWIGQWMNHIVSEYAPISVQQQAQGEKRGSNISRGEQALGVRPANRYLTDPAGYEAMMRKVYGAEWKKKQRSDAKAQSQYGGIE